MHPPARTPPTLHLIGSAHLDPVWLWDQAEGLNEGIATCRAAVSLLREFPGFRFIRGEAAVYDHIARHAPALLADIRALIAEGRWDVVGGNWIQPDTNLPGSAALLRQFLRGKEYFRDKLGVEVAAAWAADSFGHSAGLPDILAAAGLDSFAFTRPSHAVLPFRQQAFWWRGRGGARILAYRPHDGWYASNRDDLPHRLDACLARAREENLETVAVFYGLGNHGGGPSRRHLREISAWAARHPEIRVEHSGLHRFFAALRAELARRGEHLIDTHEGELNFCLRGCSASVARFKYAYRRAETELVRAERTVTVLEHASPSIPSGPSLDAAWDDLLFNAFHDILPGSAIERAYDEQLAEIGGVRAAARKRETRALTDFAARLDTTAGAWPVDEDRPLPQPVLVWNPLPRTVRALVELECTLDYRPMAMSPEQKAAAPLALTAGATGRRLPFQLIAEENDSLHEYLWRRRVVASLELPAMGWAVLQMGLDPAAPPAPSRQNRFTTSPASIGNLRLSVAARLGAHAATFSRAGADWLPGGLQVRLYHDNWGSWGGMREERESWELACELERLVVADVRLLESGPERAALWVRFVGDRCRVEITFLLGADAGHFELRVRAFLDRIGTRLKLVLPAGGAADYEVPGGVARREPCGEVPGGRWVRAGAGAAAVGFASDALYGFDTTPEEFRATIARSSRYASDVRREPDDLPWRPCADLGEHVFRALLVPEAANLAGLADELLDPPLVLPVPAHRPLHAAPPRGSLLAIAHPGLRLLALRPVAEQIELHVQNDGDVDVAPADAGLRWCGTPIAIEGGLLRPGAIGRWGLRLPTPSPGPAATIA